MNKLITVELQFFLISILAGAAIFIVYDGLRIFRRLVSHNVMILAIQDIVFWVAASVFIFAMIYQKNDGIIRGFSIMGMAIGMTVYHYIISEWLVNIITKFIKIIMSPIIQVIKWVNRLFLFVHRRLTNISKYLLLQLKKITKSVKITMNNKKQKRELLKVKRNQIKLAKHKERELINNKKKQKKETKVNQKREIKNQKKQETAGKKKKNDQQKQQKLTKRSETADTAKATKQQKEEKKRNNSSKKHNKKANGASEAKS